MDRRFSLVAIAMVVAGFTVFGRIAIAQEAATPAAMPPASSFVAGVDHPYFSLAPGTSLVYAGMSEEEATVDLFTITDETVTIMGVTCVVVHDVSLVEGEVVEDTQDWFAQDSEGNVWYFGEASSTIENGQVVSTDGSWTAGVDGALPGIVMPAVTAPGDPYQQEYLAGEAEDMGQIVEGVTEVTIDDVSYSDVIVTREWSPLEPGVLEEKLYARGVGLVSATSISGENEQIELVATLSAEA